MLYLGTRGRMLWDKVLPGPGAGTARAVPKTLPRRGNTWAEWHTACLGGEPAGCSFEWAGPLTETVLLGNLAIRTGKALEWDSPGMKITNLPAANQFVKETYHNGWTLDV